MRVKSGKNPFKLENILNWEKTKPVGVNYKESILKKMIMVLRGERRMLFIVCAYLAFLSLSEYLSTRLATVNIGLIGHGLTLLSLLVLTALTSESQDQRIYITLAFAPLIRLVSISLPLGNIPMMYWYLLVGIPISLSIFLVIRYGGFTWEQAGLNLKHWFPQLLFGVVGFDLGYIEYLILQPEPLVEEMTLEKIWLPALILLIFTGFLEEVIFRGLMQSAFAEKLSRCLGILLISILFAVLHVGYQSLLDVIFVFGVALLFGILTELSGSILGVSIAHGLTNITLFLVFPFIVG
jgi:membrane protease YdiL (CAAX protease family)